LVQVVVVFVVVKVHEPQLVEVSHHPFGQISFVV
jgi:hypothetical protein